MARILYFHGLGGNPDGMKVASMRRKFGDAAVQAANFPFSAENLLGLITRVRLHNLKEIRDQLMNMGAVSERIAREACDAHKPDIIVGSSLGGGLAMRLAAELQRPAVLITPVWNPQLRGDFMQNFVVGRMPLLLQKYEPYIPLFGPFLVMGAKRLAGFKSADRVHPRSIILHAADDELYDFRQSTKLMSNSPLLPGHPDAAALRRITTALAQRGYDADGRLVKVGLDHQMDDPEALQALLDAVELLDQEFPNASGA